MKNSILDDLGRAKGRKELLQMELQIEGRGLLCLALFKFALQYGAGYIHGYIQVYYLGHLIL